MNALEFIDPPANAAPPFPRPIYAVYGDDTFLRREALSAILRIALGIDPDDMAVTRFAGDQANLADVLDEARTVPFLSPRRVVFVENADPFVTAHRKELEAYAEHPAETSSLVLNLKSWPPTTRLATMVESVGLSVDCKSPKAAALPAWLVRVARDRYGLRLDREAAKLLVDLVGDEVGLLSTELEKLSVYVGKRASIARDDVAKMVGAGRVEDVWRMINGAVTGKGAEALHDLDRLLSSGENPLALMGGVSYTLRRIHHAGQLRRLRRDLADACRESGIQSWAVETTGRAHAHLGPHRVERLPAWLLQVDLDLKGSSVLPPRVILERFLLALARPRED